jgi:hypothetical protein
VLGPESIGRVLERPDGVGMEPGDLVVSVVRRPDPVPCSNCAVGEWDMCRNGQYTKHGIKALHGFPHQRYRADPEEASAPVRTATPPPTSTSSTCGARCSTGCTSRATGLAVSDDAWSLQRALMHSVKGPRGRARQRVWEVGGPPALRALQGEGLAGTDRMVRAVERFGLEGPVASRRGLRDHIHREVCGKGFDADRRTFTQYYGGPQLDAALLLIPRGGFLSWMAPASRGAFALLREGVVLSERSADRRRGSHRGEQEGQDEPERGRQCDEGTALLVRLGHERVCQ